MPFLRSSARPQAVECFFCLSTSVLPPLHGSDRKGKGRATEAGTPWHWLCERCGCWNVRDEVGLPPQNGSQGHELISEARQDAGRPAGHA